MNYYLRTQNRTWWVLLKKEIPSVPKRWVIAIQDTLNILYYTSSHFPWHILFSYQKQGITYPISPAAQATTPSVWSSSPAMWSMKDRINSTLGCTSITSAIKERGLMRLSHIWQDYTLLHPVSKFPNTLLPSGRFWAGELVAYSYTKLFFLRLRCHSSSQQKRQILLFL